MSTLLKTTFKAESLEPFFLGGDVRIAHGGQTIVSCFDDKVILTDIETGQRKMVIEGDDEPITSMDVTPNGEFLIACSRSLQMYIYRLADGEKIHQMKAHEAPVLSIAIDHTSSLVATGGAEGGIKVWDIEGGFVTHNFRGHGGVISSLKFWGQQGSTIWKLASGSDDNKVRVWDLVKNKCLAVLDSHVSIIRGLDFSKNGEILVSGSRDKVVNIWNLRTFKLQTTIPVLESIESVVLFDDEEVYVGGEKGEVSCWNLSNGRRKDADTSRFETSEEVSITQLILEPNQSLLYAVLSDQTIEAYKVPRLELSYRLAGNHGEIIDCRFLTDTSLVLATNSPSIRLIDLQTPLKFEVLEGHRDIVIAIDTTFGGEWISSAGKDNKIILWHKKQLHSVYEGHAGSIGAIGLPRTPLAESEKRVITPSFIVSGSQDLTIKRWDPKTGSCIYTRKAHEKDINAIDVSPDDKLFATASQDRTVKIWDIETGETIGLLKGHKRGVWAVNFSHHEKVIATGSGDKTVKLWNLQDYTCLRTFEGHSGSILKTLFFNRGLEIASAAGDGLVRVWDKNSGECLSTLDGHEDRVWCLAANSEDELVSGGADGVLCQWKDITQETIDKQQEDESRLVEQEQELENRIRDKNWTKAIRLALELNHPLRLLKLFQQVAEHKQGLSGLEDVDATIKNDLTVDELGNLLNRIRDWNTSTKNSVTAQIVLYAILQLRAKDLVDIPGISKLADGLKVYSDRHYKRLAELIDNSYIVEYMLEEMEALE